MHLIHPAFVHFSVALLTLGSLCEALGLFGGLQRPRRFGEVLVLLGTLSLAPTLVSGFLAANSVDLGHAARPVLAAHERNAWILLATYGLALFWKGWFRGVLPTWQRPWYAIWLLAGVLLTVWSAMLGGKMVYTHGVGVGG